ncbi:MAG: RNA-directed DNA polymerase [Patescibacteria group bacterium]|jgi:hypothetical protein|nr:RNA-directed DNA polymerase [Patescibacteria group bacterium]MDP6756336.1 RNA-directed DNA polymerase [Patescibacteria group bacterium]|tara:strand:+ start:26720 stop:27265 length:546 start_codon:yes stop_codon:yes gene_type:complete
MQEKIGSVVPDSDAHWLLDCIINSFATITGKGIPLGNVTSQLFANIYLNEFDEYIKYVVKEPYYIRYCDDFVILHSDKNYLIGLAEQINEFLCTHLELTLHEDKIIIRKVRQGIDFLGYVVLPHYRVIRTRTKNRMLKKMQHKNDLLKTGAINRYNHNQSLQSYFGLLQHCHGHRISNTLR